MKQRLLLAGFALTLLGSSGVQAVTEAPSVLFVLDGSGSMWAKAGAKPKIDIAKTVLADLLNKLAPEVRAGLMVYGANRKDDCNDIEMLAPLGSNHATLVQALNSVNPKGMTPLTGAIQLAAAQLKSVEGNASVVVVSDGKETCAGDPCVAAREAAGSGVNLRIHVVGFDVTPDETQQLNCIAKEGKGKYFAAANAEQLTVALAEVQKEVVAPPPPPPLVAQTAPPPAPASMVLFEDHFDRNELGEMWEVLNPDGSGLAIAESKLLIVAAPRVKDSTAPRNLALLQNTPQGNFIVTVKMTAPITLGVHAGLFYWVDDKNFIFLGPWGTRQDGDKFTDYIYTHYSAVRHPIFGKSAGGRWDPIPLKADALGNRKLKGEASSAEVWYLQLERTGAKYTGRMSVDGQQWTDIGTHVVAQRNGRIGLGAYQDWEKGNEQPAEFENFIVKGAK